MALPAHAFGRSAAVEEREVTLADGSKHMLHFRAAPRMIWVRLRTLDADKEPARWEQAANELIAATVVEPDGADWKQSMTVEQAADLEEVAWVSIVGAAMRGRTEKAEAAGKA